MRRMDVNWYKLRYISGYQTTLKQEQLQYMQGASLEDVLRAKTPWPIEKRFNGSSAWAKNPGTSLYYVEAWEADCCSAPAE